LLAASLIDETAKDVKDQPVIRIGVSTAPEACNTRANFMALSSKHDFSLLGPDEFLREGA
jgi:hypothetical protein